MIQRLVIARLRATMMPPLKLVEGLGEFSALQAPPPDALLPAAYAMPIASLGGANNLAAGGFRQRAQETFAVVLLHRNLRDARGAAAAVDLSETLIPALRAALLGWVPAAGWEQVEMRSGRLLDIEDNVLAWREDYVTACQLRMA
ncbi:phage tail terminator protein [Falsiroseomonas sp.]|uniref:phage tail terminator protein n=1 Tax=Falsiroseomonas sp. TaxID=2870721 RepID=UPI003F6F7D84